MWTIFKDFIEFITILLLFYLLVFWWRDMWDLISPTRNQTTSLALEGKFLTTGPPGKSLSHEPCMNGLCLPVSCNISYLPDASLKRGKESSWGSIPDSCTNLAQAREIYSTQKMSVVIIMHITCKPTPGFIHSFSFAALACFRCTPS